MISPAVDAWSAVQAGGVRWLVAPELADQLFGPAGLRLDEWLKSGQATIVKHGPHRVVYRATLPDGQVVYIKHNLVPDLRTWLRQMVRPSKARTEMDRAAAVAACGVPTIEPLAVGERAVFLGACESYLITRGLDDTQTLNTFLAATLVPMASARQGLVRQRLAKELGKFVAKLHEAGIRHDDLHAANIMVELKSDDQPRLFLIDLHAVRVSGSLDWAGSRDNLVLLARWFATRASRADRLRFWRAYFEARGFGIWPRGSRGHREHFVLAREVETLTRESMLAFWRNRDMRCFASNRYFRRLRRQGIVGHAVADCDGDLLAELLADPDAPMRQPGIHWLKDSRSSTVVEVGRVINGVHRKLIYKRFRLDGWADPLAGLLRRSAALRSWILGHGFLQRCLPTPRPLAVLHRTRVGMPKEGYLLAEKVENSLDLHQFMAHLATLPGDQARRQLRAAIDEVARAIRNLHQCQMSQRDLKANNLLIETAWPRPTSPFLPVDALPPGASLAALLPLPASAVQFIDLAGVRLHRRLPRSRRVQNLARLHASFHQSQALTRTDKLRFLRAYLLWNVVGKGAWKTWWKEIGRGTARKIARNSSRGRTLA